MEERIIINDYIENDPLSEDNLDGVLNLVNKIRLLFPQKTIWLYTGSSWEEVFGTSYWNEKLECDKEDIKPRGTYTSPNMLRRLIISKCDVVVDGRYVDSQRDVTLKWKGSSNQRVINVKETLRKNRIVLHD